MKEKVEALNHTTKDNTVKQQKTGVRWIDAMKGIAILGVVLIHSGAGDILPSVLGEIASRGNRGVQIFFIISMYLAYESYERSRNAGQSVLMWYINRYKKIAPLYYVAIFVTLITIGGALNWLGSLEKVSVWNVLSHLLFINGLSPYYINSILGVEWYLADYALMIVVVPVLYKHINTLSKALAFFLGNTILSYVLILFVRNWNIIPDISLWETYIKSFFFFTQFPVMVLGIVLFFAIRKMRVINIQSKKLLSYTVLIASVYMLMILVAGVSFRGITGEVVYAISLFGIILSQTIYPCPVLNNCLWISLGKNSYIIYLFHVLIMKIFNLTIGLKLDATIGSWVIKFFVTLGASYVLSVCVNRILQVIKTKENKL